SIHRALSHSSSSSSIMAEFMNKALARSVIDSAYECASMKITAPPNEKSKRKQLVFSRFEKKMLVSVFLSVIQEFPHYAAEYPQLDELLDPGDVHLLHFISQGFMESLIIQHKAKNATKAMPFNGPKIVPLSDEEQLRILKAIIPLEFPTTSKFWKTADYVMNLASCSKFVVSVILQAVSEGWASFASMNFIMHEAAFSMHICDPSLIRIAALYGELQSTTIERFASKRNTAFRAKCKGIIHELEDMALSKQKWELAVESLPIRSYDCKGFGRPLRHNVFCVAVRALVKRLKGEEQPNDDRINLGWARVAVKKSAARYYGDRSWKAENMHEVFWTICAQRPSIRKFVADMLSNKYNDPIEADKWRSFSVPYYQRKRIKCPGETLIDPLSPNPPYLGIPECVTSVTIVQHATQLKSLECLLDDYASGDYPIVGLDAEWSSYVSYSKATIFQIALRTQVFIIDLDAFSKDVVALSKFFEKLFLTKKIIKMGYHFGDDLIQLRNAVTKCGALYHPSSLFCIDRLVQMLRAESIKRPEVDLEGIYWPMSSKDKKQPTLQRNSEKEQQLQESSGEERQPHSASVNEESILIDQKTEADEKMLDLCVDNIEE
uniref:3'-5' exonuclease domain-containing protein n=2 Tax=Parascaris univalens TaxID=6257 RepID=A0A915B6Z0_PARUN